MALCSRCGGGFNFYPLLNRPVPPPVEADPFCPICGQRQHITCQRCDGYGFVAGGGDLLRGYCTNCGKPMRLPARVSCPSCHGSGHARHNCTAPLWPEGAFQPLSARPTVALIHHSRSRALRRLGS